MFPCIFLKIVHILIRCQCFARKKIDATFQCLALMWNRPKRSAFANIGCDLEAILFSRNNFITCVDSLNFQSEPANVENAVNTGYVWLLMCSCVCVCIFVFLLLFDSEFFYSDSREKNLIGSLENAFQMTDTHSECLFVNTLFVSSFFLANENETEQ